MFDYRQFKIGDVVECSHHVEKGFYDTPPTEVEFSGKQVGLICGCGVIRRGRAKYLRHDEAYRFSSEGPSITCWLVRVGLLNKPLYVLPGRIKPLGEAECMLPAMAILPACEAGRGKL